MTDPSLEEKYQRLLKIIGEMESAAIAFSGGVDSALLAYAAFQALGNRAVAMTADSPSLKRRELEDALQLVRQIGIKHVLFATQELQDPNYANNPLDRCYFCKTETFTHIDRMARQMGYQMICYGENLDDQGDYRPGGLAAQEFGVRAPLKEAGLGKAEIRQLSQRFGLPVWDKPAAACLSSRFPYGTQITPQRLAMVECAEDILWELGLRDCRVRYHGDLARIEVPPEDMPTVINQAAVIVDGLRKAGFRNITLDLAGYKRGSLNQGLINL